jgi:uncharacterized protein (TIGR00255 family)
MNSMTGFGRAEAKTTAGVYSVEVSAVNNRFLEVSFRTPRHLSALEGKIRGLLQKALERGKVNLLVNFDRAHSNSSETLFNESAALAYLKQIRAFQRKHKIAGEVTVTDLLSIPEVVRGNQNESSDVDLWKALSPALEKAVAQLKTMREREGKRLAKDMLSRIKTIVSGVKSIEKKSGKVMVEYRQRMEQRLQDLLDGVELDKRRLEEEVALLAEKSDICEEITRLKSHIREFTDASKSSKPVGKRLNFILQEMNREVNTIGSKSASGLISSEVIQLKEEIERIREQVQNVE